MSPRLRSRRPARTVASAGHRPNRTALGHQDLGSDPRAPRPRRADPVRGVRRVGLPRRHLRAPIRRRASGARRPGALVAALFGHTAPVEDVAFGPDAVLVTASADWTARTWRRERSTRRGAGRAPWRGDPGGVRLPRYGRHRRGGRDDAPLGSWDEHRARADAGRRTVGPAPACGRARGRSRRGRRRERRPPAGRRHRTSAPRSQGSRELRGASAPTGGCSSPRGGDHDVIVWDVASGEPVHHFEEAQSATVADARFSPDGRWLVTAGPSSARIWHVADWQPLTYLFGPTSHLTAAAFGPDSRTVLTREENGTVRTLRVRAVRRPRRARRSSHKRASERPVARSPTAIALAIWANPSAGRSGADEVSLPPGRRIRSGRGAAPRGPSAGCLPRLTCRRRSSRRFRTPMPRRRRCP